MEEMILNETPVRTSRNFHINDIKLKDIMIPENMTSFHNVLIQQDTSDISIDENIDDISCIYGVGSPLMNMPSNKTLKMTINSKSNKEVKVDFSFNPDNLNLMDKIELIANENTNATVILKYEATCNEACFHNLILKVFAHENSNLNVIIINFMNLSSHHFMSIDNELGDYANVNYTIIDLGGKESITNYYSNLVGKASQNHINVIYLGKENELFDLNYIGELRGEKSDIHIEVEGALADHSKKHFKGTIDFKKGAKKAKGNENESCMLLSDTAKSLSLPMLLCSEEDVEGNHSSSAGKIGKSELFYLMSRGFNEKEAMKLMVRAKFNHIIESIKNETLKEEILQKIDERLD
ncbi:MAG: SufD family Fe-S cluster assembly protein [Clostridia bacterium]|nr:SufD family Fe-S cluster assembly protein [Clostridia bacterium]